MSDDDKKFPPGILPTRYGTPQGDSVENRMIGKVGGADGINTVIRYHGDGSDTRLRTHNGMPRFITSEAEKKDETTLYLETGVLETLDGTESPADWNPLDLVPPSKFHKHIRVTPPVGQHVRGILDPSPSKALIDSASKAVAAKFPASIFSGLMRSFVQAKYGSDGLFPFSITGGGYSKTVTVTGSTHDLGYFPNHIQSLWSVGDAYAPTRNDLTYTFGEDSIVLGYRMDDSCGITRINGQYWLVQLARSAGTVTVTAYRIIHRGASNRLRGKLLNKLAEVSPSEETKKEIRQLEGYLFAYSHIDLANPITLAVFSNVFGDPLAYGWKWNSSGTTARIIAHTTNTAGYARWHSYEHTITFSMDIDDELLASIATVDKGEWTDCAYVYLYAPCTETFDLADGANTYRLHRTSLWDSEYLGAGENAAPVFADVPIYGFFKNDVWKPVVLTHSRDLSSDTNTDVFVNYSGIFKGWYSDKFGSYPFPPFVVSEHQVMSFLPSFIQFGHVFAEQDGYQPRKVADVPLHAEWEAVNRYGRTDIELSFDGQEYTSYYQPASSPAVRAVYDIGAAGGTFNAEIVAWKTSVLAEKMAEIPLSFGGSSTLDTDFDNNGLDDFYSGTCSAARYQRSGFDSVGVVIPHGDSEAVFVTNTVGSGWTKIREFSGSSFVGYHAHCHFSFWTTPPLTSHDSDEQAPNILGGDIQLPTLSIVSAPSTPSTETKYSNRFISHLATTYSPVYADLWPESSLYYLRGIYSFSGLGQGYDTSEGIKSHAEFDGTERFCGWV